MRAFLSTLRRWRAEESGAVAVEVAALSSLFVVLVGGSLEVGLAYKTKNEGLQSARVGARLASTQAPVAQALTSMTGLGTGAVAGDPLPAFDITCSGRTQSCTEGGYDANAMNVLVYGPNGSTCPTGAARRAQGMCVFGGVSAADVEVRYQSSGLGRVGNPARPMPLITVTVNGLDHDWLFLERLLGDTSNFAPVSVTVMSEDMST